jgi:hypothetical protein
LLPVVQGLRLGVSLTFVLVLVAHHPVDILFYQVVAAVLGPQETFTSCPLANWHAQAMSG